MGACGDTAGTHSGSNAHAHKTALFVSALELVEKSHDHAGTSHAERVTAGNSTTAGVELLSGDVELLDAVSGLGSKGLVNLKHIHVVNAAASLGQSGRNRVGWADTHDLWGHASDGEGHNAADNLAAELVRNITSRQEDGGSTVSHLG